MILTAIRMAISAILVCLFAASTAPAQPIEDILGKNIEARASGALALLGLAAVPNETASTLFWDTGQEGATGTDFKAGQFGGGFTWSEEFPLYLEGYLGWNRYDPVFIFSDGTTQRKTEAKWNSCAASGAVGWDFKLSKNLVLRPLGMVALGVVASDLTLGGLFLGNKLGKEVDFLKDGSLTAGDWAVRFLWPIISGGIMIGKQMLRFDIHACTCGRSQGIRTL